MKEWGLQLECLADQILIRDREMGQIMDIPPEQARVVKNRLGIDEDYFLAIATEPAGLPEAGFMSSERGRSG